MIRVLHVITDSNIGGAGRMLLALLDTYDRGAFSIEVVLPAGSRLIPALTARGVPYTEAPYMAERSFSWRAVRWLHRLFKQKRPAIVHTHAALSARVAARLYGRGRIILTRHTASPPSSYALTLPARVVTGLIQHVLCDAVIAVSPVIYDDLVRTGTNPKRIHLLYNGVPPVDKLSDTEKHAAYERYGVTADTFNVTLVGRLAQSKGHDYLLDAAAGVRDAAVRFLLAGDGEREAHIKQRLAEEHIENTALIGFVEDITALLNITCVLVNASCDGKEATSLALAEGMSLGIPCVATNTGGNPYVIEHEYNGLLVPDKDAAALRDAVLRLKNDPALYRRLSDGAKRRYAERFTVKEMTAKIEALYRTLVKKAALPLLNRMKS